ncbi:unnamed protein product [Parajaminaea phylloscopi]
MPVPAPAGPNGTEGATDDTTPVASTILRHRPELAAPQQRPQQPSSLPGLSLGSEPLGSRRLYLAVDCGGSKAAAAISISAPQTSTLPSDRPVFLARGFGGAANYTDVGLTRFLRSVKQAVESALDNAGVQWRHLSVCAATDTNDVGDAPNATPPPLPHSGVAAASPRSSNRGEIQPFPPIFFAAWLGIAGVDSPLNIAVLSPHLSHLFSIPCPSSRLIVANDTSLLASPVMERGEGEAEDAVREGVVCIAGTGSIVMSFRSRGRHARRQGPNGASQLGAPAGAGTAADDNGLLEAVGRVGGFGWLLGDEAGGYMVGRRAVRTVLDQADRDRLGVEEPLRTQASGAREGDLAVPTESHASRTSQRHMLRDRILAHWNLTSTDDLLDTVYSVDVVTPSCLGVTGGGQRASVSNSISSSLQNSDDEETEDPTWEQEGEASSQALQDPSQKLLPPGARSRPSQSRSGSRHRGMRPSASPIPAIPSYPPSPTGRSSPEGRPADRCAAEEVVKRLSRSQLAESRRPGAQDDVSSELRPIPPPLVLPDDSHHSSHGHASEPSLPSSSESHLSSAAAATGVRKLRLASLAPVVFHLAFTHGDGLSLDILREEIRSIAGQIQLLLQREGSSSPGDMPVDPRRVLASRSVLCLGGSLLGVEGYRNLLVEELKTRGCSFKRVVYVEDVAKRGCEALARGWEGRRGGEEPTDKQG